MSIEEPYIIFLRSFHFLQNFMPSWSQYGTKVQITTDTFANGEINVKINENIRGKDVFIIQTEANDKMSPNDYLMELLITIRACKLSSANKITAIIPNFFYARSDKKDVPRVSINSALICDLLKISGVDRIVTLDLHAGQIQGMSGTIPFDNLYAIDIFTKFLKRNHVDNSKFILVSPDAGGIKRVENYARILEMDYIILHKQRDYTQKNTVLKSMLIGNSEQLKGKIGIVIDDMFDTCGTITKAVEILKDSGCEGAWIMATHGIFSGSAFQKLNECDFIKKVIVTDSVPQDRENCSKLEILTCYPLIEQVIFCLMTGESISQLFP